VREKCEGKEVWFTKLGFSFTILCWIQNIARLSKLHSRCTLNFFHPTCRKPFLPHGAWRKRDCSRTFPTVVDGKPFIVESIEFAG